MNPATTINSKLPILLVGGVGSIKIGHYCPQESMVGGKSAAMVGREKVSFLLDNSMYDGKRG